jgi:hypothetical protein
VQNFKNAGISLVKDGPSILCTVTPHRARCLMAFEEVLESNRPQKRRKMRRSKMRILQCLWTNVTRHSFSVSVTKISRINYFSFFHFLAILKKQTKTHSQG